jgi:ABC-type polysaccharide/polyol phosphate transport system ATPase subunit
VNAPAIHAHALTKRFRRPGPRGADTLKSSVISALRASVDRDRRRADEDRFDVLRDVCCDVAVGETVGLVGRNGSGKTTFLRLVAGILRPDEGTLVVRGRVAPVLELGAGFHPELSGRENAFINCVVLGLKRREARGRLAAIEEFAQIGEFFDAPVRTYSTGMHARLAFSSALHVDPDVLLIDEVLAVGDESFRGRCLDALRTRMSRGDRTTVLVTHDLDLVPRVCGRVLVVDPPSVTAFDDCGAGIARLRASMAAPA